MNRLGIDIGSKTIKIVMVGEDDAETVFSEYLYHRSKIKQYLLSALRKCCLEHARDTVRITVTGSAGMRVAELFDVPFVQEVVALKRAVLACVPDADVILEMGGEDTKLVYLTGVPEQRMNTVCAGGTGGFIDMMAGLMGVRNDRMQLLAMGATTIYSIASRCAVFAKSDVRPHLNAGAKKEDVAASVLEAVCTQAVAGLSAGRPIEGKVALLGGPFHYIPALRDAFCRVTGIPRGDATIPDNAHLFVAYGAALAPECSAPMAMSDFEHAIDQADFSAQEGIDRLPALFSSKREYDAFRARHADCKIPRALPGDSESHDYFIGIDAGSTTMKMALVDGEGRLVAYEYDWNEGDITSSFPRMLKLLYRSLPNRYGAANLVRRSCIIGYGEQFCRAAYRVDAGEVETVAHLRAATELEPDVDFLMDIGGQDIKCFYIRDGLIEDIVLNEACSSGCGSLFDSIARSMHYRKDAFAAEAVRAAAPVDLGTRCSTFMDSRVKHAQKDGASPADIAAGVCYSTARNALYKVVRQPDFSKVGEHVVVQGGAFANDALLRAFELECGHEVKRPDLSQVMGAWGAALIARDQWLALEEADPEKARRTVSSLLSADELDRLKVRRSTARCDQCANKCKLMVTRFSSGREGTPTRAFVTGNRCEKGARSQGQEASAAKVPPNMVEAKNALIVACDREPQPEGGPLVGIPRVLSLYESYPFWKAFFNALGCRVVSSGPSDPALYREGMGAIPSEGACYPSKLVYGHCAHLARAGAELLFAPRMGCGFARWGLLGRSGWGRERECPLVLGVPEMLEANLPRAVLDVAPLLAPDLGDATCLEDAVAPLAASLGAAGIAADAPRVRSALGRAQEAYRAVFSRLSRANEAVLARVDAGEFPGALVAGHPYHADPGIGHGIDGLLGELGYAVFEEVSYDAPAATDADGAGGTAPQWRASRDLLARVDASAAHPNLQLIIPRSFGCGIDALSADVAHRRLRGAGRVYAELKIDQIVDLAAVRIRLRSLAYAQRQRQSARGLDLWDGSWTFMDDARFEYLEREASERRESKRKREREQASSGGELASEVRKRCLRHAAEQGQSRPKGHVDVASPDSESARQAHAETIEGMRELGYELVVDGSYLGEHSAQTRQTLVHLVIFIRAGLPRAFADWDEVERFVASGGEADDGLPAAGAMPPTRWGRPIVTARNGSSGAQQPPLVPTAPPGQPQ